MTKRMWWLMPDDGTRFKKAVVVSVVASLLLRTVAAVCLKAMALRPGDRYASARELAEEMERWLADEPVRAWQEPWG